jgi:hypothetical protein
MADLRDVVTAQDVDLSKTGVQARTQTFKKTRHDPSGLTKQVDKSIATLDGLAAEMKSIREA